ncbi:MAG TPA: efflux RND transporter periplasmic adaptor subunit [Vicinamibacteria bacterium]|nr:efflux RND transporter periplasmic adaptor subunit [Vicinamibacteria bacterium]
MNKTATTTRACRIGTVAAAALLAGGLAACGAPAGRPRAAGPSPAPARTVATAAAVRTGDRAEVTVPAAVQARQRAALAARIAASVVEMPFREGQAVGAGAVVTRLDDAAPRSALAAAEAGLKSAEADLARAESLLAKDAATPRELEEATARAAAARAALMVARDGLSYAVVRAPFAGRVAARPANVGDVVSPGTTLIEIEGEGGFEAKATLESTLAGLVRPGVAVRALVDGQPRPLEAVVRAVSPAGDPATHRFDLRADLPAAEGLRSGLFARLVLPGPAVERRVTVPASALFERGGLTGVFVVGDGRARLRWVAAGAAFGGVVEVRAGLEAGERVALDPAGLEDGAPVEETRAGGLGDAAQRPPAR